MVFCQDVAALHWIPGVSTRGREAMVDVMAF